MAIPSWIRKRAVHHPIDPLQIISITIEFVLACTALGLLLTVYPESFRETLWLIGGEAGWNSNPRLRIYFYANYKEPPEIAFIWTHSLDVVNLGTSIISLAVALTRIFFAYFHMTARASNAFYDLLLLALWTYSVSIQLSGDYSDPEHLSHRPWYLEKSCSQITPGYVRFCHLSKAAFALCVLSAYHLPLLTCSIFGSSRRLRMRQVGYI
ncbi:hypothetical protein F5Y12DRAFT_616030 [Xylaria sp. FL1777]|nr:hypothetical protein F5Y12DRAFT_616030 [Xylaria sp. FL1777]